MKSKINEINKNSWGLLKIQCRKRSRQAPFGLN